MATVSVRTFEEHDRAEVIELWHRADLVRPWNDPGRDIDRRLAWEGGGLFVAVADREVIGTVMAGYDGHRGWINSLAVGPEWRELGVASVLMERAERSLVSLGCAKINLQVRSSNAAAVAVYGRLGYDVDDVISMGKRLVDDDAAE